MLYFIPYCKSIKQARDKHAWLAEMCPLAQCRETMRGPHDLPGLLVADRLLPIEFMTYEPSLQRWAIRYGSDAMIGLRPDWIPTPTYFAKPSSMDGEAIRLLDGNDWLIPRLLAYDAQQLDGPLAYRNLCDRVLEQNAATGRMIPGDVTPPYREIWQTALQIGDHLMTQFVEGATVAELPDDILENFVAMLIGHNYRIGKPEISALGLLSSSLAREVIRIGIDWSTLETNIKNRLSRSALSGTNTESGEMPQTEASITNTALPSLS